MTERPGTAPDQLVDLHGSTVLVLSSSGPLLRTDLDAVEVIGRTWGLDADAVVVPVDCLAPGFFDLSTRIAGAIVQKFVDYRLRLVIVGDITAHLAGSSALQAFVRESNRRADLWFVDDLDALDARLAHVAASS